MSTPSAKSRAGPEVACSLALLAAGAVVAVRADCGRSSTVEAASSPGVAIDAKPGSVTVVEEYAMELKTDQPGRLTRKDFNLNPGDKVKADQILAELDPNDLRLAMDKDKIDFDATQAAFQDRSFDRAFARVRGGWTWKTSGG